MKPAEAFHWSHQYYVNKGDAARAKRGYRSSWCKVCKKLYDQTRRAKFSKEVLAERALERYLRHIADGSHSYRQGKTRARRFGVHVSITLDEWRGLLAATHCHWCQIELHPSIRQIDHVVPLSAGGEHTVNNLVGSCANCNLRRKWERQVKYLGRL
jgi:5-methylcytosine-specific restriction endonuclease McrA